MSAPERQQTSPGRQDAGLWATLAKTHAAGTLLPAHQHRSGQLVFATRGVMLVETPHARWTVPPQRALWVPPHHAHAIEILSATDLRTVYCQPALVAQCASFARRDEVHAVVNRSQAARTHLVIDCVANPWLVRRILEGAFGA